MGGPRSKNKLFALLMAGGRGTRFWPKSRASFPKQFLNLPGSNVSLLQATIERVKPLIRESNIWIVSYKGGKKAIQKIMPEFPETQVLEEPLGKNTAPCLALAVLHLFYSREAVLEDVCIALPADHFVAETDLFCDCLQEGARAARGKNAIVTIGIPPTHPDTGFGYIVTQGKDGEGNIHSIERFIEKPSLERAIQLIHGNNCFWNAGIFIFTIQTFFELLETYLPDLFSGLKKVVSRYGSAAEPQASQALEEVYAIIRPESFDKGVMEKVQNGLLLPGRFSWSDIGSWSAMHALSPKDQNRSACIGSHIVSVESSNSLIFNEDSGKAIVAVGVSDLIIVNTKDALLICPLEKAQNVRNIPALLEKLGEKKFI